MSFYRGMTCENVTIKGDQGTPITAYTAKPSGAGPFRRTEERAGVPSAIAVEEVRLRGALGDELEPDVPAARDDVAEEPAVAVDVVEGRVVLEDNGRARRDEPEERPPRGQAVAVGLELRSIDLDDPDAPIVGRAQRVSVVDVGHGRVRVARDLVGGGRRRRPARGRGHGHDRGEESGDRSAVYPTIRSSAGSRTPARRSARSPPRGRV